MSEIDDIYRKNMPLKDRRARLEEVYGEEDYYWYLESEMFVRGPLKYIGEAIRDFSVVNDRVLDIGCGRGWLLNTLPSLRHYWGFDASSNAIEAARKKWGGVGSDGEIRKFVVCLLEDFYRVYLYEQFDVVVFGGILCFIKPGKRLELVRQYERQYRPKLIIIYDVTKTDLSVFREEYAELRYSDFFLDVPELPDSARKHRQVLVLTQKGEK